MRWACNDELLDETEEWDVEERWKKEGRDEREMICVRVAHSLTLRLTPIFILNLPSADYLISDIEHLNKS